MGVDEVVVVLEAEVLEDLVHRLRHRAVELGTLHRFVRADLLVVAAVLKSVRAVIFPVCGSEIFLLV